MTTRHLVDRPLSLRDAMKESGVVVASDACDGIGARLIAQAGFQAVYMTGSGTAMARGIPDFGLLTQTEMADNAGVMTRSVGVPVIADADTGYGNELNVRAPYESTRPAASLRSTSKSRCRQSGAGT